MGEWISYKNNGLRIHLLNGVTGLGLSARVTVDSIHVMGLWSDVMVWKCERPALYRFCKLITSRRSK